MSEVSGGELIGLDTWAGAGPERPPSRSVDAGVIWLVTLPLRDVWRLGARPSDRTGDSGSSFVVVNEPRLVVMGRVPAADCRARDDGSRPSTVVERRRVGRKLLKPRFSADAGDLELPICFTAVPGSGSGTGRSAGDRFGEAGEAMSGVDTLRDKPGRTSARLKEDTNRVKKEEAATAGAPEDELSTNVSIHAISWSPGTVSRRRAEGRVDTYSARIWACSHSTGQRTTAESGQSRSRGHGADWSSSSRRCCSCRGPALHCWC